MQGLKSAILEIFQAWPEWPFSVSTAFKNWISKILLVLGSYEFLVMLEGNIRETPFFKVQSGKITM